MRRLFCVSLAVAVILALFSIPSAASASTQKHWAPGSTVCVDLPSAYPTWRWNIRGEVQRWDNLPGGPHLVSRTSCAGYKNVVHIRVQSTSASWQGMTWGSVNSRGEIVRVDIQLNPQSVRSSRYNWWDRPCLRSWAMGHELGHALGLPHYPYSHYGNVMSYGDWWLRCGGFGSSDRYDYYKIY